MPGTPTNKLHTLGRDDKLSVRRPKPNRLRFQIVWGWSQTLGCAVFLSPLHLLQCKVTFHQYAHQAKYGNTMCAYTVYQIIELQVTQNAVTKSMRELFGIPASRGMVNRLKANVAERCEDTYCAILDKIVGGALVHADGTRAIVSGKDAYVLVCTSLEDVAFVYSAGREASTPQDILQKFGGVLISDFYAAYDSIA